MSSAAEKPMKICLRGLPANTEVHAIRKDLRDRSFDPIFMRHVEAKGKGPGVFCVQLQITPNISKVFDIKKMLGSSVAVEAWRGKQGPPQCQRCQGFRHSAAECLREYRCVHCARPHPSKQCNRPYDIPICANCRGPHAANDLSCPAMRREEIAKAGIVLRTSGYVLATLNPVSETNAASSLMAEANAKLSDYKRRCRKKKVQDKSRRTPAPEMQLSQETQLPLVVFENEKSLSTQDTRFEQKLNGSIIKETSPAIIKTKPVSQRDEQLSQETQLPLIVFENEKSLPTQETQSEQELNGPIIKDTSESIIKIKLVSQRDQQALVDPVKENTQLITRVKASTESITTEDLTTITNLDAVRAKVVYECILILQSVLSAVHQGHDPVPIILESLAKLYKDA